MMRFGEGEGTRIMNFKKYSFYFSLASFFVTASAKKEERNWALFIVVVVTFFPIFYIYVFFLKNEI